MESVVNKRIIDAAMKLDLAFLVAPLYSKLPPSVDIKLLLEEYKKFLVIKIISKDTQCSPSFLVDQVWQVHILHTAKYREACTALGKFIEYDPSEGQDGDDRRKKRLFLTKTHYSLIFNNTAPKKFCELEFNPYANFSSSDEEDDLNDNSDIELENIRKRGRKARRLRGSMQVYVKTLVGNIHAFRVDPSDSIWSLKTQIKVIIPTICCQAQFQLASQVTS